MPRRFKDLSTIEKSEYVKAYGKPADYRLIRTGNIQTGVTTYHVVNSDYQGYEITAEDYKQCDDCATLFNNKKESGAQLHDLYPKE